MKNYRTILPIICSILLAASSFSKQIAVAQTKIAVVVGMQTNVVRAGRPLKVGESIKIGDRLRTNTTGISQFQFRDRTTAKLGPNSSIEFTSELFQIANHRSSFAIRMLDGVARFAGSDSTKSKPLIIATPNMALGVMGGIVNISVIDGKTQAALSSGRMVCTAGSQQSIVHRSGYSCEVGPSGVLTLSKTSRSFASVLDNTDIPNVNSVNSGRINFNVAERLPLKCGSRSNVASPHCNVSSGGFPLPSPNQYHPSAINGSNTITNGGQMCPQGFYFSLQTMSCQPI